MLPTINGNKKPRKSPTGFRPWADRKTVLVLGTYVSKLDLSLNFKFHRWQGPQKPVR
jgi:hypothetical protein